MRVLFTLFFMFFIGFAAKANTQEIKVKVTIELVKPVKEQPVARLYKSRFSRIEKELTFRPRAYRSKLA